MTHELIHFGIKGMRWGQRKAREKSEIANLSSAQLREKIERMNLEMQYSKLISQQNQGVMSQGAKFIGEILVNVGKQTITNFVANQMSSTLKNAIGNTS